MFQNLENSEIQKDFGKWIKEARKKKNMYQSDVAVLLNIGRTYYGEIENGHRNCSLVNAIKICAILELDLEKFAERYK